MDDQKKSIDSVLEKPLDDAVEAWERLDDAALTDEVVAYYDALADVTQRVEGVMGHHYRRGDTETPSNGLVDSQGPSAQGGSGAVEETGNGDQQKQKKEGQVDDALGVEGVDFYEGSLDDVDPSEWQVPPHCIPIHTDVVRYDWTALSRACQFDVIMMDPPWQLATANPTRGVALGYSQLTDKDIQNLPIPKLQKNGFLFIWVINAKYQFTLDLFEQWGYTLVDEIVWVKMTVNRRLAKSHGFYLQHAKEVCLVGKRGDDIPGMKKGVKSDIIYAERRGQSQKPEEIYELIEDLVPNGKYLEIFGRKNNLKNFWVTVGNEVTGQGLPPQSPA
ncbi:N6-adenosine-methyltransferase catalytic subunit [Picochlorum sp. SENEW3]|nr:N6-adenosine-methyltransferase catalytic subunit [Picochlorum sp. SENEW3]